MNTRLRPGLDSLDLMGPHLGLSWDEICSMISFEGGGVPVACDRPVRPMPVFDVSVKWVTRSRWIPSTASSCARIRPRPHRSL